VDSNWQSTVSQRKGKSLREEQRIAIEEFTKQSHVRIIDTTHDHGADLQGGVRSLLLVSILLAASFEPIPLF